MSIWSVLIAGIFLGAIGKVVWASACAYDTNPHRAPRAMLPPATARQLRRARRAARADLTLTERGGVPCIRPDLEEPR